jgi:integrase/recombinase XerD
MSRVVVILRDDYLRRDGKASVLLQIYLNRKRIVLPTGIKAEPENWNGEKSRVKGNTKDAKDKNMIINVCVARVNDIVVRYRLQNKILTADLLRNEYKNPSVFLDFLEFCDKELKHKKGMAASATIKSHRSAIEKLRAYKKPLMFSEIGYTFMEGFYRHMKVKLHNNENTVAKTFTIIKAYLNIAVRKKIIEENPFPDQLKMKKKVPERNYLSPDELSRLIKAYRSNHLQENLQKVLRYFLFSCFTGLRISDVKEINFKNIADDALIYTPVKTRSHGKLVRVPLTNFARELIGKEFEDKGVPVFHTYQDQVTNRYLKTIMDMVGIKKKITFHSARHTFATIYLRHSKNIVGLKELMGHSNIAQTMVYAHIIYDDLIRDMEVFENLSGQNY